MRTLLIALRAAVYMVGFLCLWGWIALGAHSLDHRFEFLLPAWTKIPGVLLMVAGGLLVITCAAIFIALGRGTPAVFDPPRQFVALGPYKYVRNPMYIGALALLFGFALYLHSAFVLLLSLVWLILVHLFVVLYEEPGLRRRFGTAYEEYCRAVFRWIPRWQAIIGQ